MLRRARSARLEACGARCPPSSFETRSYGPLLRTRAEIERWCLRRGVVEHAARGFLVAGYERVFRQHLPALAVAGASEWDRHHATAVEVGDRPHLHLQHEHVARALEAIGHDLEPAEVRLVDVDRGDDLLARGVL